MTTAQLEAARRVLADHPGGEGVVIVAGRPSYAESGEVAAEARARPGGRAAQGDLPAGAAPGQRLRRARHGAGARASCRAGSASMRAAQRFTAAWGSVPAAAGLSTADILASMAGETATAAPRRGRVRALVLLGADPLDDFPDRAVAEQGARRPATSSWPSRATRPSRSTRTPTSCCPARWRTSAPGTTTNIEGRVSRLGPKLTAPGFAWPDWMIAAELAAALGADLGVRQRQRPGRRAGAHRAGLRRADPGGAALRRGARRHPRAAHRRTRTTATTSSPIDPMALPGVESVERQGAPPRVGTGASGPALAHAADLGSPPPLLSGTGTGGAEPLQIPKADNYSAAPGGGPPPLRRRQLGHRLAVAHAARARRWWRGPTPTTSTAWAPTTGDRVKVRSARGELILAAESDEGVPRGVVAIDFNVPGGESAPPNAVATLIDSRQLVTDVRLESV